MGAKPDGVLFAGSDKSTRVVVEAKVMMLHSPWPNRSLPHQLMFLTARPLLIRQNTDKKYSL
jgi:hypothetical protein